MELTIRITETDQEEGGYMYDIWTSDQVDIEAPDSEDGGQCTSTIGNALDMASQQALTLIRAHFSNNAFNNDICPSSLDENGEPMTDGETAHKWDEESQPITCAECGASKD